MLGTARLRVLAVAPLLLGSLPMPIAATVVPRGPERVVNATFPGDQLMPALAAGEDGRTFVAWLGGGRGHWRSAAIYGRWLAADGTPEGPERILWAPPQPPYMLTSAPALAADRDGGFLLAWSVREGLGLGDQPDHFLMVQRFDASAQPRTGARQVLALAPGSEVTVAVARLAGGSHVVLIGDSSASPFGLAVLPVPADDSPAGPPRSLGRAGITFYSPPTLAPLAAGGFAVAWVGPGSTGVWDARVQVFDAAAEPVGEPAPLAEGPSTGRRLVSLAPAGSGFAAAWFEEPHWDVGSHISARLFAADGSPRSAPFEVASQEDADEGGGLAIASDPAGNFVVVFGREIGFVVNYEVVARAFDALGNAVGDVASLGQHPASGGIQALVAGGGQLIVAWDSGQAAICDPFACTVNGLDGHGVSVSARAAALALPEPLLVDGQFRVWVESAPGVPAAAGAALTADSAVFHFAAPDNIEVVVKLVDGSRLNARTWVFTAGMTSLPHTLVVRHEATGTERRYRAANGRLRSVADTTRGLPVADWPAARTPPGGDEELALGGGRFAVTLTWSAPGVPARLARSRALGDRSGVFWFYDPANPELLVKVLDGRAVNGHFWVFAGGLSGVGYVLTVTDRETGASRSWQHAAGAPASFADTAAF